MQSERIERLAEFLCSEFDFSLNPCVGYSWPEHKDDDGYRGDGSFVKLQPSDVQAYARENAKRILAFLEREAALSAAEPVACQPRYKQEVIDHHRSIGSDLWEYAMTVYPTKEQAQGYGYGGHECRALYAAPPAPSVAVNAAIDDLPDEEVRHICHSKDVAQFRGRLKSALSAQVQDVAGWQDISKLEPKNGMIVMGWGEYRERDGFSPAFMRWYDSVGGWNVNAMPFYPTHWQPLPAAPAKQEG